MGRYAVLQAGVVVNVIEADADFAATIGAIESASASPGDTWDGASFHRPEVVEPVPDVVERWAAHYVLIAHGYMPAVMAAIEAIEDPVQRELARVEFTQKPVIRRLYPLTQLLQQAAGISDAERDAMFTAAGRMSPAV